MNNYEIEIIVTEFNKNISVYFIHDWNKNKLLEFDVGKCDKIYCEHDAINIPMKQKHQWEIRIQKDMNEYIIIRKYRKDKCYISIQVETNGIIIMTATLLYKYYEINKLLNAILM